MIRKYSSLRDISSLKETLKKKVVRNNSLYSLFLKLIDSGPLDGGCAILALALQKLYGGELYGLFDKNGIQHVLLKVGDTFVDADGVWNNPPILLKHWEENEHVENSFLQKIEKEEIPEETPTNETLVNKVVRFLEK